MSLSHHEWLRWAKIAEVMPGRTAKQCRERYNNHVDPAIKKDKIWTAEEDALVMELHAEHHNQFAKIARRIPGRCYDDVKNRQVRLLTLIWKFYTLCSCDVRSIMTEPFSC